jgi:glucokinase-like ROK family protein
MSKVRTKNRIRRNRILRALLDGGKMSLSDLAKYTGISLPMVSKIAGTLKRERFIVLSEDRGAERAGRPPLVARLNGDAGVVLGMDLGHRNTNMVLINLEQKIVTERYEPSLPLGNEPVVIDWIVEEVARTLRVAKVPARQLLGVGVSIPGIVQGRQGISKSYLNFHPVPVRELIARRLRTPVHIEHDAKAMAMGERWFGAARTVGNALCLNIGWGLGLGILIDGRVCYGRDGYAGEFGHIKILKDGPLCYCGKQGCLETVASGMAIGRSAREKIAAGAQTGLSEMASGNVEAIDAELVVRAAAQGDEFSIGLLEEAGRYLGEGVAHLVNLFNPERIILGGRVSKAGALLLDPARSSAMKNSHVQLNTGLEFVISTLGTKAGALGVAMLAARDIFEVEHLNPSAYV